MENHKFPLVSFDFRTKKYAMYIYDVIWVLCDSEALNFVIFDISINSQITWALGTSQKRIHVCVSGCKSSLYSHTRGCGLVHTILLSKVFVVLSQEFNLLSQVFSNVVWAVLHIFLKPEDAFVTSSISWQAVCFCVSKLCGIFQTTVCLEPYYTGTHPK